MYLNQLSIEQKELFIDLCIHASMANHVFTDEEKQMLLQYCEEMNIKQVRYEAVVNFESAISRLIEISSKKELRIVTLELAALMISDKTYDEHEEKFMNNFIHKIKFDQNEYEEILMLLGELSTLYNKINDIILKG